jgi:hypothetical protein
MNLHSPLVKKRKKIDAVTYRKRCNKGLNMISNVISRVVLSRKKIIWDVLEEIRTSKVGICERKYSKDYNDDFSNNFGYKIPESKFSTQNSKTEPSTEIEQQVFDKTDLDYYFLERLERMRDQGIKEEDYNLIEQEEKFSLERAENSFDEDLGYLSDYENQYSIDNTYNSQHSEKRVKKATHKGSKKISNGVYADYEEEDQVYFCDKGDLEKTLKRHPNSIQTFDDMGNSSVLTMELRSLLKDCNDYSKMSEMSSELCLSKCFSGIESRDNSKLGEVHFTGKYMNEDIEMMSKEIEQIRDQILKNSPINTPSKLESSETPQTSNQKSARKVRHMRVISNSSINEGYNEDSD